MPMTAGERKKIVKDLGGDWWRLDRVIPDEQERTDFVWAIAKDGLVDDVYFCDTLGNYYDAAKTQVAAEYLARVANKVDEHSVHRGVKGWSHSFEWLVGRMAESDPKGLAKSREIMPPLFQDFSNLLLAHHGAFKGELSESAMQRLAVAWAASSWDEDWYDVRESISDEKWSALVLQSICQPDVAEIEWERIKEFAAQATVEQVVAIIARDRGHVRAHAQALLGDLAPEDFETVLAGMPSADSEDYNDTARRVAIANQLIVAYHKAEKEIPAELVTVLQSDLGSHGNDDIETTIAALTALPQEQRSQLLIEALERDAYGYTRAAFAASAEPTLPVLEALLARIEKVDQESDEISRALAEFGPIALEPLLGRLSAKKVPTVMGVIFVKALDLIGDPAAAETLVALTGASTKGLRVAATSALEGLGAQALHAVKAGVGARKKAIREACAALLGVLEMADDNPLAELEKKAAKMDDAAFDKQLSDFRTANTHSSDDYKKLLPFAEKHGLLIMFPVLEWYLEQPSDWYRSEIWQGLVQHFKDEPAMPWIAAVAFSKLPGDMYSWYVENQAAKLEMVAQASPEETGKAITYCLKGSPPAHRGLMLGILLRQAWRTDVDVFIAAMQDTSKVVRELGVQGIALFGEEQLPMILRLLGSRKKDIRLAAAEALTRIGASSVKDDIRTALDKEKTADVVTVLEQALQAAGGSAFEFPGDDGSAVSSQEIDAFLAGQNQPKLPSFVKPADLSLTFADSGKELSKDAKHAFIGRLMKEGIDNEDEIARRVRPFLDNVSANAFSIALKDAWASAGGASKEKWAIFQQGILASDERLNEVAPMLDFMAQNSNHHLAKWYIEVLFRHRSNVGHSWLAYWAKNGERSSVVETAQACLERAAADAGQSADNYASTLNTYIADDVADASVPRLGLDESLVVDFGERVFDVVMDQNHNLVIRDRESNKTYKSVPKPRKAEVLDPGLKAQVSELKKRLRSAVKEVSGRLEAGMISGRPWSVTEFRKLFVGHPIMTPFAGRLVFRADDGTLFRVSEGEFLDADYDALELAADQTVRIAHPMEMSADELEQWGEHLADGDVLQPFDQLGRPTFSKDDDPFFGGKTLGKTTRGAVAGRLRRLGWRKGWAEDAGMVYTASRLLAGRGVRAWIEHGGFYVGDPSWDADEEIDVTGVRFHDLEGNALELDQVDPLAYSEIRLEVNQLLA